MASFVLVHGSGQNASCWERVEGLLRARGHVVATPELDKHAPDCRLEDHAERIAAAAPAAETAIVVAHSLSGAFLPLVPALRDCRRLVFLAAVIPEPGKSVRQQLVEDASMFNPAWIEAGPRWFDPAQQESLAREFLFHDCDESTLAWALTTLDPLDSRNLVTQPSPLSAWPEVPASAIVAAADRTLSPRWCRGISRSMLGEEALEIASGHCPHVCRPEELARLLHRLAEMDERG